MSENALRGRCECGHVFIIAHLPMEMTKVAKLAMAARCPTCASTKIFVATNADIDAQRADGGTNIVMTHTNIAGSQP